MFFVNLVIDHWIIASIVYFFLTIRTVAKFLRLLVFKSARYQKVSDWLPGWRCLIVRLPMLVVLFLIAPLLYLSLPALEDRERKRAELAESLRIAAEREKAQAYHAELKRKNGQLALKRKEWFQEHQPRLFYRTMGGITAVLRPADYERVVERTYVAYLNETWGHDYVLMPSLFTFIYANRPGLEHIAKIGTQEYLTGTAGEFFLLMDQAGVELILKDDIFVPFVNETLMNFAEQRSVISTRSNMDTLHELVTKQAPKELQPIGSHY
jgi:hypothetical protein